MGHAAKPIRHNRTLTVDFHDEATYFGLLAHTKAFVEFVLAFLLALGFQLLHKASCSEGGCLTRHSHYARVRLGGLTIWRIQCTRCKAVFTVLPHFVLRYHSMRPDVARNALLATHGGLSLELCAVRLPDDWSGKGNRWVERMLSLRHTCRIRGRPTFPILVEAVSGLFKGENPTLSWITPHKSLPVLSTP